MRERIAAVLQRPDVTVAAVIPTSRVKAVIDLAVESARQIGDDAVDTEHLLLGLVREGQGIAVHVLEDMGATPAAVEAAVLQVRGIDPATLPPLPPRTPSYSPTPAEAAPALRFLHDATTLARTRGETLSSEHVLLALSRSSWGRAAEILAAHGLTPEALEGLLGPPA